MAAGPRKWTEEIIAERYAQGRGQGTRETYAPWIRVQEFSSSAPQTRIPSLLFKRGIHTFSYLERAMYLHLEFEGGVLDYREQFPMDRRVTLGLAKKLKIRHPVYPFTRVPMVINLDALVTLVMPDGSQRVVAFDAKPTYKLLRRRIQDKLILHKAFCKHIGIEHRLFTELSVPKSVINNIDLTRGALPRDGEVGTAQDLFSRHAQALMERMRSRRWRVPVWEFCARYDSEHGLQPGSSLRAYYYLIWTRQLVVNLNVDDLAGQPVPHLATVGFRRSA